MYNITIGRLADDPEAQGVIRPADDSWQLVVDKDGFPHLMIRVHLAVHDDGDPSSGMIPLDMFLTEGTTVRDLMSSEFGGEVTDPAEIEACLEDFERFKSITGCPCPKA